MPNYRYLSDVPIFCYIVQIKPAFSEPGSTQALFLLICLGTSRHWPESYMSGLAAFELWMTAEGDTSDAVTFDKAYVVTWEWPQAVDKKAAYRFDNMRDLLSQWDDSASCFSGIADQVKRPIVLSQE